MVPDPTSLHKQHARSCRFVGSASVPGAGWHFVPVTTSGQVSGSRRDELSFGTVKRSWVRNL